MRRGASRCFPAPTVHKGIAELPNRSGGSGWVTGLDEVHCSHGAEQVRVLDESAAWGGKSDFAAVSFHSSAAFLSWFVWVVVVDAVVVAA